MGYLIGAGALIVGALGVWGFHIARLTISSRALLRTLDRYHREKQSL